MTEEEIKEFQEKYKHLIGKVVDVTVKSVKFLVKDCSKECWTDSPYENAEYKEFKNYTFEERRLYSIDYKFVEFSHSENSIAIGHEIIDIFNVIDIKKSKIQRRPLYKEIPVDPSEIELLENQLKEFREKGTKRIYVGEEEYEEDN